MLTRVASSKARKRGQESAPCWEARGSSQGSRRAAEDGAPWPRATFSLNYLAAETGSHSSQRCLSPNYSWAALKHRDRAVGAAQGSQSWRHMGTVLPGPRQGDITASKPHLAPGPGDQRSQPGLMSFAFQPPAPSLRSPSVSTVTVKDYKNTKNVLKKPNTVPIPNRSTQKPSPCTTKHPRQLAARGKQDKYNLYRKKDRSALC